MSAWLMLFTAGLLEIVWAISLKHGDGFTSLWPSVAGVTTAAASFVLLAMAVRTLPVGTAYAVWVGLGAVGVTAAGILLLGEEVSALRLVFLAMVTVGIAGLRMIEG